MRKKSRNGFQPLGVSVVLKLLEPLKQKSYNVTTDNVFSSVLKAKRLKDQGRSIAETIRASSQHLC